MIIESLISVNYAFINKVTMSHIKVKANIFGDSTKRDLLPLISNSKR